MAYVTAMFMTGTDMQIVNVALPTLSHRFSAPLSEAQWTAISYLLALAVLIPASGWIGDRVGLKRTFVFALALFTAASALCGLVHTLGELIAARALQGVGGGMLTPSGTSMLYRAYPPERRARVARTIILPILIGPASAPILGGALTEWVSWRWVFLINVPVGVTMVLFCWRFLPRVRPTGSGRLDLGGLLLSGVGLSSLLYAVSEGSALGWGSMPVMLSGLSGIALLAAFSRRSLHHRDPILRIRLLRDRLFRATNIVFALSTGPFLGSLYLTPIFLQEVLHQSPLGSGTTTFVEAVGVAIGSQTLARLYPRFGPRALASLGAAGLVIYLSMFLLVVPGTNLWLVRALMLFGGYVNSGTFLATQTAMFTTIPNSDLSHAAAIYNTQRQSTIALNVAVLTTIVAGSAAASISAFHCAYLAAAVIAAVGTISALTLIHTSDAHATMGLVPVAADA
ncbi:MAG TPA: DHA2 family efflux MFS transporter permease subunit [Solirubrobacteraceae bacterium]|nr:DHA2 family efflux MFS transporter permease subunit [Solirubrobacteraceae bacterium]